MLKLNFSKCSHLQKYQDPSMSLSDWFLFDFDGCRARSRHWIVTKCEQDLTVNVGRTQCVPSVHEATLEGRILAFKAQYLTREGELIKKSKVLTFCRGCIDRNDPLSPTQDYVIGDYSLKGIWHQRRRGISYHYISPFIYVWHPLQRERFAVVLISKQPLNQDK